MQVSKSEQHEQERIIFATRADPGMQAMRSWLFARRDKLNADWPGMVDNDLTRLQGEARLVARLIKMIDFGPLVSQQN